MNGMERWCFSRGSSRVEEIEDETRGKSHERKQKQAEVPMLKVTLGLCATPHHAHDDE